MKSIPVRSIQSKGSQPSSFDRFKIRSIREILGGTALQHDLHRHDFYFILAVQHGDGMHEIDFTAYPVADNSVFFVRPGQVHKLHLKAGSEGYLVEFDKTFQFSSPVHGSELLRKAAGKNCCLLNEDGSGRLYALLQAMLEEYTEKQENYLAAIQANLELFLIHLLRGRQHKENGFTKANLYRQEKLEQLLDLLEKNNALCD